MIYLHVGTKRASLKFARAFEAGCSDEVVCVQLGRSTFPGPAAFWGVEATSLTALNQYRCQAEVPWYYGDNGYLHRERYKRISVNHLQATGLEPPDYDRLRALDVEIQPWRRNPQGPIVLCPHSERYHEWLLGASLARWISRVKRALSQVTNREVVVRWKPSNLRATREIEEVIGGAWAVVVEQSNVAVDALLLGVPAVVLGDSPARQICSTSLDAIEAPYRATMVERRQLLAVLAGQQWTFDEISSGLAWEWLSERTQG